MTCYCPHCHLVVANGAPDRVVHNGVYYHRICLTLSMLRADFAVRRPRPIRHHAI